MKYSITIIWVLAILLCFQSCGSAEESDSLAMKKEHFFSEGPLYSFPISVLDISCDNCKKGISTIVCYANDLYEQMNIRVFSEDEVRKRILHLFSINSPVEVSSEAYEMFSKDIITIDSELLDIYTRYGIEGIIRILSSKDLYQWENEDYERFKYLISLCWDNDVFFTKHLNDEYPLTSWLVSGNKQLVDLYYGTINSHANGN